MTNAAESLLDRLPDADTLDRLYPALSRDQWPLDPECVFLNHGAFGACPKPVLAKQQALRDQLEANPLRFLLDAMPPLADRSRHAIADLINADADDVAFVRNATGGVNAVLRSLRFDPGDEILILNHAYNACANVVRFINKVWGTKITVAHLPWPIEDPSQATEAVMAAVTRKTKLAMIDHVTSASGLVLPIQDIVHGLKERGVETLVDGAHAPGMVNIDVKAIGAAYYTGNCHKWLCAPKTCAFLHVRSDMQDGLEPEIISHGSNGHGSGADADFQERFAWPGTTDPTSVCVVADSIEFLSQLLPGGMPALQQRNHNMAVDLRKIMAEAWGTPLPCPDNMIGSLATMPLFKGVPEWAGTPKAAAQNEIFRHMQQDLKIEAPQMTFGPGGHSIVHTRLACQAHNHGSQVLALIQALAPHAAPCVFAK